MDVAIELAKGFPGIGHGDRVFVKFSEPRREDGRTWTEFTGETTVIVGLLYVSADGTEDGLGMRKLITVRPEWVEEIRVLETSAERKAAAARRARGEIVFPVVGETGIEVQEQLETLAEMVAGLDHMNPRRRQLMHQFDDIADAVELAETKRTYILRRAALGWGHFNPALVRTDDIYRIKTVRPIPADFEPRREDRVNRERRLDEAIRIFGEAERETRSLLSWLRGEGYAARRAHPNGFEVKVQLAFGPREKFDVGIRCSENGLWEVMAVAENKRELKLRARAVREGMIEAIRQSLGRWIERSSSGFPEKRSAA